MRPFKPYFILSAVLVAALTSFAFFLQEANAARAVGGGFSGGTVRGVGGAEVARGPEGGVAVKAPDGAVRAEGARGGEVARGREGGAVARGPEGGVAVKAPDGAVRVDAPAARPADDWDHFGGPGWNNAVAGAAAGGSVGFTDTLPADVTAVVVGGQNYYVSKGVYYQECFMGSDVNYCVVPAPQ